MPFIVFLFPMAGSMLNAMFSGRFDTKPSEDGSYFIDRDGTHFRYILNYLRTGQLTVSDGKILRRELLAEAEFYQVEGIISELTARPFKDSVILSSDQRDTLMKWLKETQALNNTRGNLFFGLIYRASRDGWAAADFHSRCDYKGPTVTVIASGKSIFGGYTERQWKHMGKHQAWGPFLEGPETFSCPEIRSKISNLMITELFYSPILNMQRGSFLMRNFRRIHFSVFRYRLIKNSIAGPKRFRGFRETGPSNP